MDILRLRRWCGDEEDEPAASDGLLEAGGVEDVRLEQHQPLRRAGETPQQRGLALVPYNTKTKRDGNDLSKT